jgi:hypothetical protein
MVASHSRELPAIVGEFISGLVIGIIALVIVKGFKKIFGKKNNTIKIKYYQLMMTIQQIETDNPLYQLETDLRNRILLRPIGVPDHAWEMHDHKAWHFS